MEQGEHLAFSRGKQREVRVVGAGGDGQSEALSSGPQRVSTHSGHTIAPAVGPVMFSFYKETKGIYITCPRDTGNGGAVA